MAPGNSTNSQSYLPFFIIGIVLIVALAGGVWWYQSPSRDSAGAAGTSSSHNPSSSSVNTSSNTTRAVPTGAQPPHVRGEAGAPVTLEEFGDFQCPPCARLHPELKKIEAEYGSRLRVIFRNYPLPIHEHAVNAARAAEAAGRQGRFWEMHDMLYDQQNTWKNQPDVRPLFTDYAATIGLDVEQFKRDVDSMEVTTRIGSDVQRAGALNITGTPAVLLNGRPLPTEAFIGSTVGLRAAIDAALAGKQK